MRADTAWKTLAADSTRGWFDLRTEDLGDVPVRIFMTRRLLEDLEDGVYRQIVNATRFPGVRMVCITPDAHFGYGVPVGSVIITDGSIAMGPVGYDIGCGMVSACSDVPASAATPDACLRFNREVIARIGMGAGEAGRTARLSGIDRDEFQRIIRGGAEYYVARYGERILNIHPSLLPAFPGLDTHARALAAGVKVHGCTVHVVTGELDTGPIVMQAALPVRAGETAEELAARVLAQEHVIYPRAVRWFLEDRLVIEQGVVRVKGNDAQLVLAGP